jgi:hypothetical protein
MNVCPCCGNQKTLTWSSGQRVDAKICSSCGSMEHFTLGKPWYVDRTRISPTVTTLVADWFNFVLISNTWSSGEDTSRVNIASNQYHRSKDAVDHQFVLISCTVDKAEALGVFNDANCALAAILGRLDYGSTRLSRDHWKNSRGVSIYLLDTKQSMFTYMHKF